MKLVCAVCLAEFEGDSEGVECPMCKSTQTYKENQ